MDLVVVFFLYFFVENEGIFKLFRDLGNFCGAQSWEIHEIKQDKQRWRRESEEGEKERRDAKVASLFGATMLDEKMKRMYN